MPRISREQIFGAPLPLPLFACFVFSFGFGVPPLCCFCGSVWTIDLTPASFGGGLAGVWFWWILWGFVLPPVLGVSWDLRA